MANSSGGTPDSYWMHLIPGGLTLAISASPVPEPEVYALAGLGLLAFLVRRKNSFKIMAMANGAVPPPNPH
jgi:hypothetical protein